MKQFLTTNFSINKFALMVFFFSLNAFASEAFLVKATNDEDREVAKLYLSLDENKDIERFIKRTFDHDGELVDDVAYDVGDKSAKVVLMYRNKSEEENKGENEGENKENESMEILSLQSENFSPHQGGNVELVYLYNGITGSSKSFPMDLSRNGDEWELTVDGNPVSHLHMVSHRKWVVGTIGIKYIKIIE